jgi:hypothetical protein
VSIANQDISRPFEFYISIGMVQKHLKDFAVAVSEFQRIKLAESGTYHAGDIHSEMLSVIRDPNLGPFLGPAFSGAGIAFDAHLVQVPDIYGLIEEIAPELLQKFLPLCFILARRPGLRHFQAKITC